MNAIIAGLIIGLLAGVLSGMFGIGGGLIIVPALVFAGLSQHTAVGTSLTSLLMPVGLLGVMQYANRKQIDWRYSIAVAIGLFVGVYFGARITGKLTETTLQRAFGVLLLAVAARFFVSKV